MPNSKVSTFADVSRALKVLENKTAAAGVAKFFQAFPGGYGEGDRFLGLKVPVQRKIAKEFKIEAKIVGRVEKNDDPGKNRVTIIDSDNKYEY